jgi:hypothetical protein
MSPDVERLEATLFDLRGERAGVEATPTREDLARSVDEWLAAARAHAAGSSRLVLGGQASGEHLAAVLSEDRLADEGLAARTVARLEAQGFGAVSDRAKKQQLAKLDEKIAAAVGELREIRKREAIAEVEAQYAGEAA